jgi:TfoX/Sxy family transcriptional regulator of competence genes
MARTKDAVLAPGQKELMEKEYLDFVMEQLSGLDELSSRAMMGTYILYYRGRIFGGIYDDRLLVKPVPMALRLMPDAEMELPYNGAKEMILVDNVDDRQFLCELVESMWEELPMKKSKKKKGI